VWPCIHWMVQNTKQIPFLLLVVQQDTQKHPFLIRAGGVYTICIFLSTKTGLVRESRTHIVPIMKVRRKGTTELRF
jgi:hypothetical protein